MNFLYVFAILIMALVIVVVRDGPMCDQCRMPRPKCICGFT